MKKHMIKAAAWALLLGMASCADDLDISSIDPQSSSSYDPTGLLAKQYATLGLTGQAGPTGKADMSINEGESSFYRTLFNLQELCSDECIWAWQTDPDIPTITNIAWNSNSPRVNWAWQRFMFNITLFNSYLSEQEGVADRQTLAEVRFLRALNYWAFLDLFRKAPFKITFSMDDLPVEKAGKELYDWIDQELTEIEPMLAPVGSFNDSKNFGRADQGAAYALHARLALNSEVYTDGAVKDYQKAIDYCDKVIGSGKYALSVSEKNGYSGYAQVFMGDNDYNPQAMREIIFPIRQDGVKTRQYGGSTYLVSSMRIAGMPYTGTDNTWSCNFARQDLVFKFFENNIGDLPLVTKEDTAGLNLGITDKLPVDEVIAIDGKFSSTTADVIKAAKDDRAMFYGGVGGGLRTLNPGKQITGFVNGLSIVKWQNLRSDGTDVNDRTFSDTDIPFFRLAELYLTRAEAAYRMGRNDRAQADLNVLRSRANAVESTSIDGQMIIDEWCREFYMEGRRRSDLVRFGLFTSSKYLWDFKGGVPGGTGVDSHFNVYPVPFAELAGNPNIKQNPGY